MTPAWEAAARAAGLAGRAAQALAAGAALHRAGRFYEAHEAWEEAWLSERGEARLLLQGLIQLTAACHKAWVQPRPAACARLCEGAIERLGALPEGTGGLHLAPILQESRALRDAARAWAAGGPPPAPALAPALPLAPGAPTV